MSAGQIDTLFTQYPDLECVEKNFNHRVAERIWLAKRLPKGGVAAEIGVFTGLFSEQLMLFGKPRKLFLVDPWWTQFGDVYPDWGAYTAQGRLSTRAAYEAAKLRSSCKDGNTLVEMIVETSQNWLSRLPDDYLDWVYLDSSHTYNETIQELWLLSKKVKRSGIISGDDWYPRPCARHHGVFQAVQEFVKQTDFCIIVAGRAHQWMLQRMPVG